MKICLAILFFCFVLILMSIYTPKDKKEDMRLPIPGIYLGDSGLCNATECFPETSISMKLMNGAEVTHTYVWNKNFQEEVLFSTDSPQRLTEVGSQEDDTFFAPIDKRDVLYQENPFFMDLEGKFFLKEKDYLIYPLLFWKNSDNTWIELINKNFIHPMD